MGASGDRALGEALALRSRGASRTHSSRSLAPHGEPAVKGLTAPAGVPIA